MTSALTVHTPCDALSDACDVSVAVWQSDVSGLVAVLCFANRPLYACTVTQRSDASGR